MIQKTAKKKSIDVASLLKYQDSAFIENAFWLVLDRRTPDAEAFSFYLEALRAGRMTKAEVLWRLSHSAESRNKCRQIKGLLPIFLIQTSYRIPLIGRFFRFLFTLFNLAKIADNLAKLEAYIHHQFSACREEMAAQLADLSPIYAGKVGREELETLLLSKVDTIDFTSMLSKKVDRDEFLLHISTKADKEEMQYLATTKADKEEFQKLRDNRMALLNLEHEIAFWVQRLGGFDKESSLNERLNLNNDYDGHLLDAFYVSFEDRFRGSREDIQERQKFYLKYIYSLDDRFKEHPILDIGCGRGEWLQLLKENQFSAIGVDKNRIMIAECRAHGLNAVEMDMMEFLHGQIDNSFSTITCFHVVEHLSLKAIIQLFDECLRVLLPGGIILVETPNAENLLVGACYFYTDPTHTKPLVPETLKFIAEQRGFIKPEIKKLNKKPVDSLRDKDEFKERWFYSEMDYCLVACKGDL